MTSKTERDGNEEVEEPQQKKQEISKGSTAPDGILEEGKVFFMYRPRVGFEEASSISDIQRFYMILAPENSNKKRLIPIGKKKLPAKSERFFGFVSAVADDMEQLIQSLGPETHETKTQGTRHTEPARIAGEGRYSIVEKQRSSTHLVWLLEVPKEPGDVQQDLCISKEGNLTLSIKNPKKANPPQRNVGLSTKADFGDKQTLFDGIPGGYAWIAAKDPSLLDYQNAELLFIGTGDDITREFGGDLEEHLKDKAAEDAKQAAGTQASTEEEEEKLIEEMKKELAAPKFQIDETPAEQKEWK